MNAPARFARGTASRWQSGSIPPLMPSLERRRLQCYLGLLLADIAALFFGMTLAGYLYEGAFGLQHGLLVAQLVLPVFLTVAIYNGAYSIATLERAPPSCIARRTLKEPSAGGVSSPVHSTGRSFAPTRTGLFINSPLRASRRQVAGRQALPPC